MELGLQAQVTRHARGQCGSTCLGEGQLVPSEVSVSCSRLCGDRGRLGAGPPGTSNPSRGEASGEAHVMAGGCLCQVRYQSRAAGPVETESVRKTGAGAVGRVLVLGQGLS